jgi:hypothetical protein
MRWSRCVVSGKTCLCGLGMMDTDGVSLTRSKSRAIRRHILAAERFWLGRWQRGCADEAPFSLGERDNARHVPEQKRFVVQGP